MKGVRKDRPSKDIEANETGRNLKLIDKGKEKQTKQATGKASTKSATSISVEEETKDGKKKKVKTEAKRMCQAKLKIGAN